ncbi:insulin-like peptide 3 [Cochliomyia hominivorax]
MKSLKYIQCSLLLLLLITDVNTSVARYRLCGDSLTQFLSLLCIHGYNSKNLKEKKSVSFIDYNADDNILDITEIPQSLRSLFMNQFYDYSNSLMVKTRRQRHHHGVADECCKNTCTYAELSSYCKGSE